MVVTEHSPMLKRGEQYSDEVDATTYWSEFTLRTLPSSWVGGSASRHGIPFAFMIHAKVVGTEHSPMLKRGGEYSDEGNAPPPCKLS